MEALSEDVSQPKMARHGEDSIYNPFPSFIPDGHNHPVLHSSGLTPVLSGSRGRDDRALSQPAEVAKTKRSRLGGSDNKNLFPHNSGGWEFQGEGADGV